VVLHQTGQNLEGLGPQGDFFAASAQKPAIEIQRELAERVFASESFRRIWLRYSQPKLLEGFERYFSKISPRHHDFKDLSRLGFCQFEASRL
jgi:hypothetical protein